METFSIVSVHLARSKFPRRVTASCFGIKRRAIALFITRRVRRFKSFASPVTSSALCVGQRVRHDVVVIGKHSV